MYFHTSFSRDAISKVIEFCGDAASYHVEELPLQVGAAIEARSRRRECISSQLAEQMYSAL